MIQTTGRRVVVEPIRELPSEFIIVPGRRTRWRNGELSICGQVVAVGRENAGVPVGSFVYHSDSCGEYIEHGKYRVIHEDDIMFLSDKLVPAQWIGAEENYDG